MPNVKCINTDLYTEYNSLVSDISNSFFDIIDNIKYDNDFKLCHDISLFFFIARDIVRYRGKFYDRNKLEFIDGYIIYNMSKYVMYFYEDLEKNIEISNKIKKMFNDINDISYACDMLKIYISMFKINSMYHNYLVKRKIQCIDVDNFDNFDYYCEECADTFNTGFYPLCECECGCVLKPCDINDYLACTGTDCSTCIFGRRDF